MDPLAIMLLLACAVILVFMLAHEQRDQLDYEAFDYRVTYGGNEVEEH